MLTSILIAAGAIVIVGLIWLVMRSGAVGKLHTMSGTGEVHQQQSQADAPRSQSQSKGAAQD